MDFIGSRYCRLNRSLVSCFGLWPYENIKRIRIQGCIFLIILLSGVVNQLTAFITHQFNFNLFLKLVSQCVPNCVYILKYATYLFNVPNLRAILNHIQDDWSSLTEEREHKIIEKYAQKARIITIAFMVVIYSSLVAVCLSPLLPRFLNIVKPLNESRPLRIPIIVEYFCNQDKYFYIILLHIDACDVIGASIMVATETTSNLFVQHACGLYDIVSYRLETVVENSTILQNSGFDKHYFVEERVKSIVRVHQRALEFSKLITDPFMAYYFCLLLMGVLSLSIDLYILANSIVALNMSEEMLIALMFVIVHFSYMFYCNYIGQEILDHSCSVFYSAYDTRWYMAPLPVQKLLLFVMRRSMVGSAFVTGGIFTSSFEGFSSLASTSMTYFTVLFSMNQ